MTKIKNFFKSITNSKKKVFALALATCVIVLSIAGSSIAYFTDTAKFTNTFTAGNVKIQLSEAEIQKNTTTGNVEAIDAVNNRIVADSENAGTQNYGSLFPKQTIHKDPTIKNTGSEDAYIGAIITITSTNDFGNAIAAANITDFIKGLPQAADATVKIVDTAKGYTLYVVYKAAVTSTNSVVVFSGLSVPATWGNTQMGYVNGLNIVVDAYAVQTAGMGTDAYAALKTAFATEWTPYGEASATVVTVPTT